MGRHTRHGGYIIEWKKVRTYVVPMNLKDFKVLLPTIQCSPSTLTPYLQLTPFVTKKMRSLRGDFGNDPQGGLSGDIYLNRWKQENGVD